MGGLKSIGKKIKKFFKKLGKQIKTNLKHGAKYIAPVLISAITGGFGSGIVKSLFGGKIAGALSNLGNNTIGKLFGGVGSKAKQIAGGSKMATEFIESSPTAQTVSAMLPGVENVANVALDGVKNILSPALGSAAGSNAAASLVSKVPLLGAADKLMGAIVTEGTKNGITGALAKAYGGGDGASVISGGSGGGSASKADLADFYSKIKPHQLGDDARTIEVDPNNISGVDKKKWQNTEQSEIPVLDSGSDSNELRKALIEELRKNNEEDERFRANSGYRPYVPFNYGLTRSF